jgi:glycosyltransferase involved in cell wall biosynthesis
MRPDVLTSILPTSTAMLHTSTVEGLPGVILEALAVGTPVVAGDIPPNREVANQLGGVTLVGLDQPVSEWADALAGLLVVDSTKAERLGRLKAFRSSEFAIEQHMPKLLALWRVPEPAIASPQRFP